jgi:hypothetical protein
MGRVKYQLDKDNSSVVHKIHEVVVHKITLGDVDDPDLMVADPIYQWQQTDAGKFVMENAVITPKWERYQNPMNWGHTYVIIAELEAKKLTEFYLRWGKPNG